MSDVQRLHDAFAAWLADMRMTDPLSRIPLCRIEYAVSAPAGQPLFHTFAVKVMGRFKLAGGAGQSIDEAARKCWLEFTGLKRDGLRGPFQAILDAAGEDGVVLPSNEPPGPPAATVREGGGDANRASATVRTATPAGSDRGRGKSSSSASRSGRRGA